MISFPLAVAGLDQGKSAAYNVCGLTPCVLCDQGSIEPASMKTGQECWKLRSEGWQHARVLEPMRSAQARLC